MKNRAGMNSGGRASTLAIFDVKIREDLRYIFDFLNSKNTLIRILLITLQYLVLFGQNLLLYCKS